MRIFYTILERYAELNKFDAVIFDMDGTLIAPLLDFTAIRSELGIAPGGGILETIDAMPPKQGRLAYRKLLARELNSARRATLMPGALDTLDATRNAGLKTALLTRNAAKAMRTVLKRCDLQPHFDLTWSREQGPIKPEPDGIIAACKQLGVQPKHTVCVGDFRYDIEAANAAGTVSVLLATDGLPDFAKNADYVIKKLADLLDILEI